MTKTLSRGRAATDTIAHLFELSDSGDDRIVVRHDVTAELAGFIVHSSGGYITCDENSAPLGIFETVDDALRGIYDAL